MNKQRRSYWLLVIIFSILCIDQVTKYLAVKYLQPILRLPLTSFLWLSYLENDGAAFGFLPGNNLIFVFINLSIIMLIYWQYRYGYLQNETWCVGLICGGAIGNLTDRLFRGYVVDFIDLRFWPVFNFADSAITIAGVLLFYRLLRVNKHHLVLAKR